jgi:homoserine kinase
MISAMASKPKSITVRVPASTSNLGSGFDTLGLALRLYNYVRVTAIAGKGVAIVSAISEAERAGATAMAAAAARLFFRRKFQGKVCYRDPKLQGQHRIGAQTRARIFSKEDTVHSLNRAALVTAAFASGDLEGLRGVFDDRFHQPYREELVPQLSRVIRAGETAGAIGGFLSGSGSAIICLTSGNEIAVAKAMRKQLPNSAARIFAADNAGFSLAAGKHRGPDSDTTRGFVEGKATIGSARQKANSHQ